MSKEQKYTNEQIISVVEQYLEAAEIEYDRSRGRRWGYFNNGWAGQVLRYHLKQLKKENEIMNKIRNIIRTSSSKLTANDLLELL